MYISPIKTNVYAYHTPVRFQGTSAAPQPELPETFRAGNNEISVGPLNTKGNACFTPSSLQYKHQWLWDSAFHAIILAHYGEQGLELAKREINTLLAGQWGEEAKAKHGEGFIAQIQFNTKPQKYAPGPEHWATGHPTSGITQPPIIATAVREIVDNSTDKESALAFLKQAYPKILKYHEWLRENRMQDGLAVIVHPWESGLDNSPSWDDARKYLLPQYQDVDISSRQDTNNVDPDQRPKNDDYKVYLGLLNTFKNDMGWDHKKIGKEAPFRMADPVFNTLFVKANNDLSRMAEILAIDAAKNKNFGQAARYRSEQSKLSRWADETKTAMNARLWDNETGLYYPYDFKRGEPIKIKTVQGLLPLYASIPTASMAQRLIAHMNNSNEFNSPHGIRSTSEDAVNPKDGNRKVYTKDRYWTGPVWINTMYLLDRGLTSDAYRELPHARTTSERIKQQSKALLTENGSWEYYSPVDGHGLGTRNFCWSELATIM